MLKTILALFLVFPFSFHVLADYETAQENGRNALMSAVGDKAKTVSDKTETLKELIDDTTNDCVVQRLRRNRCDT